MPSAPASPRPLDQVEIVERIFSPDLSGGGLKVPNHPFLPVLLIRGAFGAKAGADGICTNYERNGWVGAWVWQVFDYHHFHPDAHEALSCSHGWAELRLGGPNGEDFRIEAGDALVLPAGVGHCLLAMGSGFEVCGAYPPKQLHRSTWRAEKKLKPGTEGMIAATPMPETDPFYGSGGPLVQSWGPAYGVGSSNR